MGFVPQPNSVGFVGSGGPGLAVGSEVRPIPGHSNILSPKSNIGLPVSQLSVLCGTEGEVCSLGLCIHVSICIHRRHNRDNLSPCFSLKLSFFIYPSIFQINYGVRAYFLFNTLLGR